MKISLEGQAFSVNKKTGVGWYANNLIENIFKFDTLNEYNIVVFDFLNKSKINTSLEKHFKKNSNVTISICTLMPFGVYIRFSKNFAFIPYEILLNTNPDISHFFSFFIPYNIKSRTIVTVYDMVYKLYPETMSRTNYSILHKNLHRSCRDSDAILTISTNSKNEISEYMNVPESKIHIAHPAVNIEIYSPQKDCDNIKGKYKIYGEYILYLGTLEPRKNIPSIIKAFSGISGEYKDLKLVLAGGKGWMYEEIFRLIKDLKLDEKVVFTGYVSEEDKPALYSGAIAFVFPSLYEGFGIPPLEAMACGTPVIVSNTSSLPEVVGDAGILVNPYDVENLAYEMECVLNDTELRKTMSEKGLIQAGKFSWEDSAKKVLDIYKKLG